MLQAQPDGATQLPSWGHVPPRLRAALGQSCRTREKRQLGAQPPLSLSLPAAQDTRRSQESPGHPSPVAQTPREGDEPPPCRECLSGLGSLPEHCSSSRAAQASLLTFLHSFSLAQWRTFSTRSLERLMEGQAQPRFGARSRSWGSALAAAVGRQLLRQAPLLLPLPQELLAVLQREGPATEGIFRRAASATEFRELREALDRGAHIDLGSQPALLLAVILKDFLRSIPAKLLVSHLYEDWMQAMERTSKQAKVEELKAVAEKLPAANLLLLQRLLSLLQRIGHNASTSRMTSSNLAVCLGPNLLSPPNEDQLPLQAMLEVTAKVNVLVEFMIENRGDVFGEETPGLSCPSAQESPAPMAGSTDLRLEEQSGPAGRADKDHQATACLDASPSLLDLLKEAGGDTLLQSETAEAPRALPPTTPESAAEALVRPEQRTSLPEERR
ncbi:T-cell activation Rho GTPase-activating protein-like [Gymnogyps californianus]|uniref:T-cell activation Rho GTPase-activating protein-like n=1 Tax=Gymnogyps californianus TaxID=33616 RepID=UPI0021C990A5|nr:T-cell activation Rho GTPase-activating protein-like [Gymnogyps californianus]